MPGTILKLEIHLSDSSKPIVAIGEIVWLEEKKDVQYPFEGGIKFINIDPCSRDEIINLCKNEMTDVKWIE